MVKIISNMLRKLAVLIFLLGLVPGETLRADIIDDVTQLEKPKKKLPAETDEEKIEDPQQVQPPLPPLPPPEKPPVFEVPKSASSSGNKKDGTATAKLDKDARRKLPIHLASDGTSTYSKNGSLVHLEKNVVITQEDLRLQADEAKVKIQKGNESSAIDSAEMIGKVNLARYSKDPTERITARGDRAVFDNTAQLVTIDGNARLWRDGHLIKGDRIVYEIVTGMVKVDRVQGVVQPEKAGK